MIPHTPLMRYISGTAAEEKSAMFSTVKSETTPAQTSARNAKPMAAKWLSASTGAA